MISPKLLVVIHSLWILQVEVKADYHIGFFGPRILSNTTNQLDNGTCCNPSCSECSVTLRYCFRETGHSQDDTESPCSLSLVVRANLGHFYSTGLGQPIQALFSGSFQVYIRVSHHTGDSPDFDPPFTDPLIDNIFIEVCNLPVGRFDDVVLPSVPYNATGVFGRVSIELRINARCAEGFNGSDCSTFCQEVDGELMCERVELPPSPVVPTTAATVSSQLSTTQSSQKNLGFLEGIGVGIGIVIGAIAVTIIAVLPIALIARCAHKKSSHFKEYRSKPEDIPTEVNPMYGKKSTPHLQQQHSKESDYYEEL